MISKETLETLGYAIGCYLVALLLYGYSHGGGDQIEILPILKYWADPQLYPFDFHVQFFADKAFTERTPFLLFLNYTSGHHTLGVFLLHAFSGVALFYALIDLAKEITGKVLLAVLAVLTIIALGPRTSLGSNEIYYAYLIPSLPAKALSAWSLLLFLRQKWTLSVILIGIATFFQPLVGIQIFLILALVSFWYKERRIPFLKSALYYLPALLFLGLLFGFQSQGSLPDQDYFNILEFRVAHHFFPSHFELKHYALLGGLLALSLPYLYRTQFSLFLFNIVALLGCLVYTIFVEVAPWSLVLNTQWFKTTLWVEAISIMALWGNVGHLVRLSHRWTPLIIIIIVIVSLIGLRWTSFINSPLFPDKSSLEVNAAEWAKANTSRNAIFLLPTTYTSFKYHSERSSFVDYKAMIHHHDYLEEWKGRIEDVYQFDITKTDKSGILRNCMPSLPITTNTGKNQDLYLLSIEANQDPKLELVTSFVDQGDTLRVYQYQAPSRN